MALFESYERRIDKINAVLNSYGIASIEEAEKITKDAGLNVYDQVKKIQPICFENACWAYTVAVSYTHLDVYKRQDNCSSAICCSMASAIRSKFRLSCPISSELRMRVRSL